jgi:imidazolonepropionase-like amidohydrolase
VARTVFQGGVIFDGTGADPSRIDVAVEGGRIVELGRDLHGDDVVDIAGRGLLPGLIDCHAHVGMSELRPVEEEAARSASRNAFAAIANLRATLDGGVTTVRDAGFADAGYRDAIAAGEVPGPRLLVSLVQLSPSAGPYDPRTPSGFDRWVPYAGIPLPVADGPDALRAKVRELVQLGADVVKVFATGHWAMGRHGADRSMFRDEELVAIVDEAHRQGIRVMAHAHGAAGAAAAARAGADSIEHGVLLDDAAIEVMAEAGTVFVPTLLAAEGLAPEVVARHRDVVRRAYRRGIRIAMGTDCPIQPHGTNLRELELLTACGISPAEALRSGTGTAAELLGLEDEIGRVLPGLAADLVVVDGDPLDVVGLPGRIRDVYRDGRRVGPSAPLPERRDSV